MRSETTRLVCFDLGGVIVRTRRSWEEACAAAGVEPLPGGLSGVEITARELDLEHQLGRISDAAYLAGLRALVGGDWTEDTLAAVHGAWLAGEFEGMERIIRALHDRGIETACLSNTNALHWAILDSNTRIGPSRPRSALPADYAAFRLLRHRHASHLIGFAKPSPEIFHEFERRSGHAAGEILFFDDLDSNVAAAREAGWLAERIDPDGDPAAQVRAVLERFGVLPGSTPAD